MEFSQPPPIEMLHPVGAPPPMGQPGADFSMPPPSSSSGPGGGAGGGGDSTMHNTSNSSRGNDIGSSSIAGSADNSGGGGGRGGGHHQYGRGGGFHNNHHGGSGGGGFHGGGHRHHGGGGGAGTPGQPFFRPFGSFGRGPSGMPMTQDDFDGKRLRKSVMRKTVDYNASIIRALESRVWQRDYRDRRALQPESIYAPEMFPPPSYMDNPTNAVTTRFVKTATNKMRCPIFTLAWTPEGRRLVTGASSGEFTLWNGLTFNFETILQAHDCPVRTMVWSHNDNWMVTGDHQGNVKYWQSNMNNVRAFQAHKDPVRGISFSPSDNKFVSCSDDGTLRVFDFLRCQEEKVLRGHGADVKCVHWHPQKALIVSGSKDNQQPIKLWDPKSGQALATLHAHKSTVMDLKWNDNGNWLITASRDHLLKLFDLRNLKEEVQVFRGHKKEASAVSWHPVHEGLFSSGGSDGSILFWNVGTDKEVGAIEAAHDSIVWTLAWHPLGHILCSGSNDHTIKFWTRNRPGDQMRDKYNLNTLPVGLQGMEECEIDDNHIIPGMGPEDKIDFGDSLASLSTSQMQPVSMTDTLAEDDDHCGGNIPGLDLDSGSGYKDRNLDRDKKVPYSKPIPRNFQAQWNDTGRPDDDQSMDAAQQMLLDSADGLNAFDGMPDMSVQPPNMSGPPPTIPPPPMQQPSAIIVYGKTIAVTPGTRLAEAISEGPGALNRFISAREIPELNDSLPDETPPTIDDQMAPTKRPCIDHNVQLIFDQDSRSIGFIPPLMALNVPGADGQPLNVSQPPPDFAAHIEANGGAAADSVGGPPAMVGDLDDREMMWSSSGPPMGGNNNGMPWNAGGMPPNTNMGPRLQQPPPPNGVGPGPGGNWMQSNGAGDRGDFQHRNDGKFGGRRDVDGRRVSRFDTGNGGNSNNNNGNNNGSNNNNNGGNRGFGGGNGGGGGFGNRGGFGGRGGGFGGGPNIRFGGDNNMPGGPPGPQHQDNFGNNGDGDFGNRMNNNRNHNNNRPMKRRY